MVVGCGLLATCVWVFVMFGIAGSLCFVRFECCLGYLVVLLLSFLCLCLF